MQIEWEKIASKQLERTITYITENFGERYATEILQSYNKG